MKIKARLIAEIIGKIVIFNNKTCVERGKAPCYN